MKKKQLWRMISVVILGLMCAINFIAFFYLPDSMAYRLDLMGLPESYASSWWVLLVVPAVSLAILLTPKLVKISSREYQMPSSREALDLMVFAALFLFFCGDLILIAVAWAWDHYLLNVLSNSAFGITTVLMGLSFRKIEPNFFVGIRTPWTLASERNWGVVHNFASRLWVFAGVLMVGSFCFEQGIKVTVAIGLVICILPVLYSYWEYKKHQSLT